MKHINFAIETLIKFVYPYEYIDSWEKLDETKLPTKEEFHSNLTMADITDEDYKHEKKVWKDLNEKF